MARTTAKAPKQSRPAVGKRGGKKAIARTSASGLFISRSAVQDVTTIRNGPPKGPAVAKRRATYLYLRVDRAAVDQIRQDKNVPLVAEIEGTGLVIRPKETHGEGLQRRLARLMDAHDGILKRLA